ncbi:MAG: hypothetical protein HC771_00285 [Synechococcales cyanobacterium CRU_2_2]|nr:hypothetical protein [Synechococcales cyanobacterium CRU_2_2]
MYEKLFSIKIPGGWAVTHHAFGDVDPVVNDGVIVNDEFYSEDLLVIEPLRFDGGGWVVDQSGYAFDLGWYPEANPEGFYRLTLLKGGWDDVIVQFQSRDRHQVHRLIEQCFSWVAQGAGDEEIARQANLNQLTVV